jgi:hypothetical protein
VVEAKEIPRCGTGNDVAGFEQHNARSEEQSFAQIVSDENDGFAQPASERAKFALKLGAGDGIKRAERLVHKQYWRIDSEGASEADALTLAAGKLAWVAVGKFSRIKPNECQQFSYADRGSAAIPFFERRNETHIFRDSEMREKPGILNHIADATAKADGVPVGSGTILDEDFPLGWK